MLEKLAEMVRVEAIKNSTQQELSCMDSLCPAFLASLDGSTMFARKAVLLVARALEKELGAVEAADEGRAVARFFSRSDDDRIIDASDALDEAFLKLGEALYRLTHEAKEGGE